MIKRFLKIYGPILNMRITNDAIILLLESFDINSSLTNNHGKQKERIMRSFNRFYRLAFSWWDLIKALVY